MVIPALVLLLCPSLAAVDTPFSLVLAAQSPAEVGAYYAEVMLPADWTVDSVDPVAPFVAVWFVAEDRVLRMAGWQTANPGTTGDVPILRITMQASVRGMGTLTPANPQVFSVAGDEADSTVQGCKVRVGS